MGATTAESTCALATAVRELLSPGAVRCVLTSDKAEALKSICKVAEDVALVLLCTPAHLSVAEAGVDLMLHLARVAPPDVGTDAPSGGAPGRGREGVVLERLLTPLSAVLQPAVYGESSRVLRFNASAHMDAFAMARAACAVAGAGRFLRELPGDCGSCCALARALPKACVAAVSLLQCPPGVGLGKGGGLAAAERSHGAALGLLEDIVEWVDRAHPLLRGPAREGKLVEGSRGGVWAWRRALGECGAAAMLGVLRECAGAGRRWSMGQVRALFLFLSIAESPFAAGAAEEEEERGGGEEEGLDACAHACDAAVDLLRSRLGDWWGAGGAGRAPEAAAAAGGRGASLACTLSAGGDVGSMPSGQAGAVSDAAGAAASSGSAGVRGGDLVGAKAAGGGQGGGHEAVEVAAGVEVEADAWLAGLVAGLEMCLTKTEPHRHACMRAHTRTHTHTHTLRVYESTLGAHACCMRVGSDTARGTHHTQSAAMAC